MTQRIGASRMENQPCILRASHIMSFLLLGCGIFVCLALIPIHVWAQPPTPVIRSIVPAQPAPGQVVTIQGHSLVSTTPSVQIQVGQSAPLDVEEVLLEHSNVNEVYVRLPEGLGQGNAVLTLTVNGSTASYNRFQVAASPAAPIPRMICDTSLSYAGCQPINSASVGQRIGIQAFGTDITDVSGVTAVFSQGPNASEAEQEGVFFDSDIGIVNEFIVPEELQPGTALVQLMVRVRGNVSALSFALRLTIQ